MSSVSITYMQYNWKNTINERVSINLGPSKIGCITSEFGRLYNKLLEVTSRAIVKVSNVEYESIYKVRK